MESFDGILMVPPDRGQILGRAVWKARYVVIGRRSLSFPQDPQSNPNYSQLMSTSRSNFSQNSKSSSGKLPPNDYFLSVYKYKDDEEPVQQYPLSGVSDCQVQSIAHPRKQGPVLPTLIIAIADKDRKRRSSRATGFMSSSKDSPATTVIFRTPPDDHHASLHEWARFILSKKGPLSPETPVSPQFTNPFSPQTGPIPEYFPRPGSDNQGNRGDVRPLHHKSSTATYSTGPRERPNTFTSGSPSLRSKKSDISSPSSNINHSAQASYPIPGQHYTTVLPNDLPSPITSVGGDYQGDLIEGWTSAQGRASTISSAVIGRDSISSQARHPSVSESSSPPGPRETILDRAFQLRCIPGMDREVPGEDQLSSLARFDALMREADEKRRQRLAAEQAHKRQMLSAFEADDSSEEDIDQADSDDTDSGYDETSEGRQLRSPPAMIRPQAQRALDFIANRHQPPRAPPPIRPNFARNQLSFHADMPAPTLTNPPPARPHTAHAKSRPNQGQRIQSTSQLPPVLSGQDMNAPVEKVADSGSLHPNGAERQSSSSMKRLSFTEFTKRLSSTSSLLLLQTNTSGGSSRGSSEADIQSSSTPRATSLNIRSAGPTPQRPSRDGDKDDKDKSCNWRGSVGMITSEGGFF